SNLFGVADSHGSGYFDLSGNYDLGNGIIINGHVGRQNVHGPSKDAASYTDYKIGATIDLSGYALAVALIGTNAKGDNGEFYHNA
ncbi:TorF family putative porin, partial [Acinetobacter baumannii]